jgi:multidrug efflux system membrane fusion protein
MTVPSKAAHFATPPALSARVSRREAGASLLAVVVIVGLAGAALAAWLMSRPGDAPRDSPARGATEKSGRDAPPGPSNPVVVAAVRQGTLDVHLNALGTVTPLNTVVVRSRVDGQLMRVMFKEGQSVKAGDLLAQIDPRPFEVQLTLATGQLARNQAQLGNARTDLERYRTLLAQDSISLQQVDTQEALVRQLEAAVQADQGGIDSAKLQLSHARVTAPISGRVGLRQVDPGNIVRQSDPGGIVVITQMQPMGVLFPIPEDSLPRVLRRLAAGDRVAVEAWDRAQKVKLGSGRLLTADNVIDPATGTVKLKAEFANADGALYPNQFVNVRLAVETRTGATLAPTAAIQRGAAGPFVYVVRPDRTVAVTAVTVGPAQGEVTAIDSKLSPGTLVVVDGADRLREGARVEVVVRGAPARTAGDAAPGGAANDKEGSERSPATRSQRAGAGG